jgi:hypothetical protein
MLQLARNRRRATVVAVTVAIAAAVVAAFVATAGGAQDSSQQTPAQDARPNGAGPATERLFSVFRHDRSAADAMPAPPAGAQTGAFGIDRSASHRIKTTSTSSRAWALPAANDYSCIAYLPPKAAGPGMGCNPSDGDPNIMYVDVGGGAWDVFGLVRDGYDHAAITFADGTHQDVAIDDNAFSAHADAPPQVVSLTGSIGPTEVDLHK